jgi:Zinc-binding dehydrogenase
VQPRAGLCAWCSAEGWPCELRPGGRLVAFGFANLASGPRRRPVHLASQVLGIPLLTPLQLMNHDRTVAGVNIGRLWEQVADLAGELRAVLSLWDQGKIKPRVDRSYPFTEAAAAHRRLLRRQNVGKVVSRPEVPSAPQAATARTRTVLHRYQQQLAGHRGRGASC